MKMSQNHSRGSADFSCHDQNSKNSPVASTSKQAVLQNHSNKQTGSNSQNAGYFDSPYKGSLSEIKCMPPSADPRNDFKTPIPVRNKSKIIQRKTTNKRRINKSCTKKVNKGNYIIKLTKDNFGQSDVDPNHLQMALALSKSTYVLENPGQPEDIEDSPNFLSIEKIAKVKTTLERYGFKSNKPKLNTHLKSDQLQGKRSKISKYHFITPVLKTRTEEERESLITSKISSILQENYCFESSTSQIEEKENKLFSTYLKKFGNKENIVFGANKLSQGEIRNFSYYNKNLNISPTRYHCGCLLRNWEDIPGREKSPTPSKSLDVKSEKDLTKFDLSKDSDQYNISGDDIEVSSLCQIATQEYNTISDNSPDSNKSSIQNSISPDLFDSDDETDFSPRISKYTSFSQSLVKSPSKTLSIPQNEICPRICPVDFESEKMEISNCNIFSSSSGVLHFESYNTLEELSQEVSALGQPECEINRKIRKSPLKYIKKSPELLHVSQSPASDEDKEETLGEKALTCNATDPIIRVTPLSEISNSSDTEIELVELDYKAEASNVFKINQDISTTSETADTCDLTQELSSDSSNDRKYEDDRIESIKPSYCHRTVESVDRSTNNFFKQICGRFHHNSPNKNSLDIESSDYNDDIKDKHIHDKEDLEYVDNILDVDPTDTLNSSSLLNVTDYVNKVLNKDLSTYQEGHTDQDFYEDFSKSNLTQSSCSQESILISDEELNYSSIQSNYTKNHMDPNSNADIYEISDSDGDIEKRKNDAEIDNLHSVLRNKYGSQDSPLVSNRITELKERVSITRESLARVFFDESFEDDKEKERHSINKLNLNMSNKLCNKINQSKEEGIKLKSDNENIVTPEKNFSTNVESEIPPNLVIKTKNVTPMVNYDELDTPTITKNLEKFGVKPLKRQRGVKLLKYLYDCTHPFMDHNETNEISSDEGDQRVVKKRRNSENESTNCNLQINSVDITSIYKLNESNMVVTNFLERENQDLIFERKKSGKNPSCSVPLQIVWHNFICSNPEIEENILTYEPLQLEVLHVMLKQQSGCKFHIQDLTTFLDKKCITIRTSQEAKRKK